MHRPAAASLIATVFCLGVGLFQPAEVRAQDGFRFSPPVATIGVHAGRAMYSADSDLYRHIRNELTLDRSDFAAFSMGADLALTIARPLDVVLGIAYSRSEAPSEFRDFIDLDDQPIQQITRVSHMPLTAGFRAYPLSRGRSIGQYAWIPARFTPYIGAGLGVNVYSFEQNGDFVDSEDLSIFNDDLRSSGSAFTAYGELGGTYWLNQTFGLTGAGRYSFGEATLDDDFQGSALDLSGFHGSAGLSIRF